MSQVLITNNLYSQKENRYTVTTPIYEGPMDLLLHLIERAELDITKLSLAKVTDQYLLYIRNIPALTPEQVSEFLIIASKLLQIKSEALLPRPPDRESDEEDPGDALAKQLLAYKRYKQIASFLSERVDLGYRSYLRLAIPEIKMEGKLDLTGIGISDLVEAANRVFSLPEQKTPLTKVVTAPKVTIREKILLITSSIKSLGITSFYNILNIKKIDMYPHLHIVVAFLALLELVKRRRVFASQTEIFGDIELQPSEAWDDNTEAMELEFGE